jgi:coproporphyrinogen III oxidase
MTGIVFEPTGEVQSPTVFGRYYGIDVHPKNPRLGMIHAAFLVQYYPDGTSAIGGTLNVLPGAASAEDLAMMKAALDEVFEKHGVDGTPLRKRVCEGTELAVDKDFRRRLACVGASFFGYPMMSVNEDNFLFMTEAYDRFVGTFLDIVEKRKNAPYTDEDIAKQDAMRLNWFEDQMFADPYAASGITPYEVWSTSFTPPVVKF